MSTKGIAIALGTVMLLAACGTEVGTGDATTATTAASTTTTTSVVTTTTPGPRDADGNLLEGDGWELVSFTRSGLTYGVAVAENADDVQRMWQTLPFDVPAPQLDFAQRVLIVLGHAVSGSCPEIQFQGLQVEADRVYGSFTFDHGQDACTSDANPAAYLLAVDRDVLPDTFTLSLEREDICGGCEEDRIEVDLTDDAPDASQWWARSRFGIVLGGSPPVDSHVFEMHFGDEVYPLAVLAADWNEAPTWFTGGSEIVPDRVVAYTADCEGDGGCIEDLSRIERTGPACEVEVALVPRQDLAIIITFADDGSCQIDLVPGSDGTEY